MNSKLKSLPQINCYQNIPYNKSLIRRWSDFRRFVGKGADPFKVLYGQRKVILKKCQQGSRSPKNSKGARFPLGI